MADAALAASPSSMESMRALLLDQLNRIVDPCSVAAAVPAGLVDMGLVRGLHVQPLSSGGTRVEVVLSVTHAFCMMSGVFVNEVETLLRGDPAVTEFDVTLDTATLWTEELMTPEYRARLEAQRTRKGLR